MVNIMFQSNSCVICGYSISDPVCRSCYIRQVEVILKDLDLPEIANEIILRKIRDKFPTETLNDTECILCGINNVTICRYCFSIILTNILKELNFTEDMIENFGYSQMYNEGF